MRVLVVVQNLPVPMDRRVWLECRALTEAGHTVSVICPKAPGDPAYQLLDGVHLFKYSAAPATGGAASYLMEFVWCWLRTALLSRRVRSKVGFDVIQACNPPDTYWLLGMLWRRAGVRYVFDQHDLNPELFRSRFGEPRVPAARLQYGLLRWLERRQYSRADHVVVTNDSYRAVAISRGRRSGSDVTVVRSGPDTSVMVRSEADPALRAGRAHLLVYLGIMGPQDNVDVLLDVMHELVVRRGRSDVQLGLLGFGDCLEGLRRESTERGLDDYVTFTGRADATAVRRWLSTADLGVAPDLRTPLNDLSTHNKVMEYMAFGLPTVAFDLHETSVTAGGCAALVPSGDVPAFADAIEELLADADRRARMGADARRRCVTELDWRTQKERYVGVFDALAGAPAAGDRPVDALTQFEVPDVIDLAAHDEPVPATRAVP